MCYSSLWQVFSDNDFFIGEVLWLIIISLSLSTGVAAGGLIFIKVRLLI